MRVSDIPQIQQLSVPEQILLVEDIWDNISLDEALVTAPHSHIVELERRLAKHQANPGALLSLGDLKARIESRK